MLLSLLIGLQFGQIQDQCPGACRTALTPVFVPKTSFTSGTTAQTLYVGDGGADNGACTTAAAPCLSLQGALAKLAYRTQNTATINILGVDDGGQAVYTERTTFDGVLENAGTLILAGPSLVNYLPATGSAAGTFTSTSNVVPATFTDTNASFTTDDLVGGFLAIDGGAASGQVAIILSNTATSIVVAQPFATAPGNTGYTVMRPGAKFTASTSPTWTMRYRGAARFASPAAQVKVTGLDVESTAVAGIGTEVLGDNYTTVFINVRLTSTNTLGVGAAFRSGLCTVLNSYLAGPVTALSLGSSTAGIAPAISPSVMMTRVGLRTTTAGNASNALSVLSGQLRTSTFGARSACNASGCAGVQIQAGALAISSGAAITNAYVTCDSSSGDGILMGGPGTVQTATDYVTGCARGLVSTSPVSYLEETTALTCNNITTTCLSATQGGRLRFTSATVSGSAPTQEVLLDSDAYTIANVTGSSTAGLANSLGSTLYTGSTFPSAPVFLGAVLDRVGTIDAGTVYSNAARVAVVNGGTTAQPSIAFGCDAGTVGVLSVAFPVAFSALPACTCSNDQATPIACGVSTVSTTNAAFNVTGGASTGICFHCIGTK